MSNVLKALAEQRKQRLLNNLYEFCTEVMHYDDMRPQPHAEMCAFLTALVEQYKKDSRQHKGMLLVPRGCLKTSIGTIALAIWLLARNPNARILISSHTHEVAKDFLQKIKGELEQNPDLRAIVGDWKAGAREWSEDAIIISARTEVLKEPSIDTAGVNKAKTGGHYDFIINDDLHSENNIDAPSSRARVYRYVQTMYPILEPGGVFLIIATRWATDDAPGRLLKQDEERRRKHADAKPEWETLIREAHNPDGSLYYPHKLSEDFLTQQKQSLDDKMYSVWYLNRPMSEGSQFFPKAWWQYFDGEIETIPVTTLTNDLQTIVVRITLALDPAYSSSKRADAAGITVVAMDNERNWWVLEAERVFGGPVYVVPAVMYFLRLYNIHIMSVETMANQELYRHLMQEEFRKSGYYCSLHEYKEAQQSKNRRIESLQPLFKQKKMFLRRGLSYLFEELEEWTGTPADRHDDLLDSLAQHQQISSPPGDVWRDLEELDMRDVEEHDEREQHQKWGLPSVGGLPPRR